MYASHSAHIGYVNLYMINNELVNYSVVQKDCSANGIRPLVEPP
jgi:hypothetical protein